MILFTRIVNPGSSVNVAGTTTTLNLIDGVMAFVVSFAAENGLDRTVSLILRQHLLAQIPGLTANFESALIAAIAATATAGSLASTEPAVVRQQG
jgi:hypothetical protein